MHPRTMVGSVRRAAVVALVLGISAGRSIADPMTIQTIQRNFGSGDVRGLVAVVDLTDPLVDIVVDGPRTDGGAGDALLTRTDQWRASNNLELAVNANYFGTINATEADIVGLSVSDGVVVSPVRTFNGVPDPAIVFTSTGAHVGRIGSGDLAGVEDAVAGVGGSTTDNDPGSLLVENGVNLGSTARVQPSARNPRTSVGVSADGHTLYVAVIDGRQPGWSVGVTLDELGTIMIDLGADDAINLDGGGSSSFVASLNGQTYENRPSDGAHRGVANHLGVRLAAVPPSTDQIPRPIRGAWMRPTGNPITTDSVLDKFAEAGGTDLFLETFYHGLATNDSSVFNDRFASDILQDTIDRAMKRGIRVHAWVESSYWSYSGSGNYILSQHPDWKVVDDSGTTDIGDIAGQVFVNLGNPGVQAMMASYCAELASNYPMLWGIQTDYHRFPLDNNTGDSQLAPYSFDTWSRSAFQSEYGVDPLVSARYSNDPYYDEFVAWRRNGIGLAAKAMHDAIVGADSGKMFSGAIFATAIGDRFCNANPSALVKMQDWPVWAANGWMPVVVPMAYGSSTTSISNDLRAANNQALNPCGTSGNQSPNARVIAGLAIINPTSRPGISSQLNTAYAEGNTSFIWFEVNALVVSQANIDTLASYILSHGPFESGDFNEDGQIDAYDWNYFFGTYTGTPFQSSGPWDLTGDHVVNDDDAQEFLREFRTFHFGEDARVGEGEYLALLSAFTAPGETWPRHLFDLTGDGVVDCADVSRLRTILTDPVPFAINPDVDGDGTLTASDVGAFLALHAGNTLSTDMNHDGSFDFFDIAAYLDASASACP